MVSTPNSEFVPPVEANDFLPPIRGWVNLSGLFIVGSLGVAIALAAVTKYNVTVKAPATVRPAGELRLVQAATEGSVKHISVVENQTVKKGDVIVTLDDTHLQTQKSQQQINIRQSQQQLAQINVQIRTLDRQILAETDRTNHAITLAETELSRRRRDYRDQQITTVAQVNEAKANLNLAQEELHQAQARLKSAQANLRSSEAALRTAQAKRNRYQPIAELGALSQNQFEEAQLTVEQQEQAVAAQQAEVEGFQQAIERQKQAVAAAKARLDYAKAALHPTQADVAIAQQQIPQAKATAQATLATLNREREALIQQQIELQKQLERDTHQLQQVEREIRQTVIRAPIDGIIFQLNLRNPSQTLQPGAEIAQIVPNKTPLVVKALVPAQEINKVEVDQPAQLRISACPYPDYGTLNGKVRTIAPDAISGAIAQRIPSHRNGAVATASREQTGTAVYEVTIEPEKYALSQTQKKCTIQLGMEGRADIISRQETILKFLLRKARLITDL